MAHRFFAELVFAPLFAPLRGQKSFFVCCQLKATPEQVWVFAKAFISVFSHILFGQFLHGNINRQLSVISRPSRFSLETLGTPGQSLSTTQVCQVVADRSAPDQPRCPVVARR